MKHKDNKTTVIQKLVYDGKGTESVQDDTAKITTKLTRGGKTKYEDRYKTSIKLDSEGFLA